MTNGEKHIEKLLSWYKEAVTENGVCYLTCDDKNTLAYAIKCCKHFEDIKKDIDSWMLREESSSSEKPNKSIEEKCPCYHCEYFEIKGWSHCKIHEDAYGDSRCNDYHKVSQDLTKVKHTRHSLGVTIEIMRKYKKIQEIVKKWELDSWTDNLSYESMIQIREVLEDGNEN